MCVCGQVERQSVIEEKARERKTMFCDCVCVQRVCVREVSHCLHFHDEKIPPVFQSGDVGYITQPNMLLLGILSTFIFTFFTFLVEVFFTAL